MKREIWEQRRRRLEPFSGRGMTYGEISRQTGVCVSTLRQYADIYGFDFGRRPAAKVDNFALRAAAVAECAAKGMSSAEAAEATGLNYQTVRRYAKKLGLDLPRPGTGPSDAERTEAMAAMYRAGRTLQDIGEIYGISRERVRQVLTKYLGMNAEDGGYRLRAKVRREKTQAEKDARCLQEYGYTFNEMRKIRRENKRMRESGVGYYRTPLGAFTSQKANAKARGIDWRLNFREWWAIWQASGKWDERGRGHGYMMCRFGDTGAYEVGNVYISTGVHNGKIQPNNPYRKAHPDFDRVMAEKRTPSQERKCSLHGCDRKHYANGLCNSHYNTQLRRQKRLESEAA